MAVAYELIEQSRSVLAPATPDNNFPSLLAEMKELPLPKEQLDSLVRVIVAGEVGASEILEHTPSMGRAGWYRGDYSSESLKRKFGGIFVASTGTPRNVDIGDEKLHDLAQKNSINIVESKANGILGVKTRADCVLDARGSIDLMHAGVRARLPLLGFFQKYILLDGSFVQVDTLIKSGKITPDMAPYASLWAMETPLRLVDFTDIVDKESFDAVPFFVDVASIYATKQRDFLRQLIERNSEPSAQELFIFTMKRLSQLESSLRNGNAYVDSSLQNLSLHGESCDNSIAGVDPRLADDGYGKNLAIGDLTFLYYLNAIRTTSKMLPDLKINADEVLDSFTYKSLVKVA